MKNILFLALIILVTSGAFAQTVRRRPSITRGNTTSRTTTTSTSGNNTSAAVSSTEVAKKLAGAERGANGLPKLKFDNAPSEMFLQIYAEVTGRTLLTSPDVPKVTMSLRSNDQEGWTRDEYLQAIETQLQLNGIGLIPVGEHFLMVVPFKTIGQQGIDTHLAIPAAGRHTEEGKIVRQIITPKNISAEEAQKAIEGFRRPDGQIQYLERTNSLLITDTQENVNRMIELIEFMDKPLPVTEEVHVRAIKYAKAADIKTSLEEFVAASQEEEKKKSVSAPQLGNSLSGGIRRGNSVSRSLPGVTRPQDNKPEPEAVTDALVSDADRGMIRGKVQIMADERSNQLIIVTRPTNMQFFDRIINVLDIETAPEIAVEIIRLKYAQAETVDSEKGVSELLNELIDSSSTSKDDKKTNATASAGRDANLTNSDSKLSTSAKQVRDALPSSTKSKLGELRKENIKILPDKRINAVMVMASPGDLAAIKEIIAAMDIPVAQVLIETVVLNVTLDDNLATGVQWLKRISGGSQYRDTFGGGGLPSGTGNSPTNLFGEITTTTGTGDDATTDTVTLAEGAALGAFGNGSQYFGTIKKLNLDFLITATESDSRTKVLTSPILMTQDNKEATLENTELKYLYNGMKYMGSSYGGSDYQPDIKQEEIGLTIKVTPRINPDGTVVLTFEETFQDATKEQEVPGDSASGAGGMWPVPTTRKLSGSISVSDGQTVILGGLVTQSKVESEGGIPILKNIPYIGRYIFGYTEYKDQRNELLVFLTPHVFKTSEEAQAEAKRRKDYLDAAGVWNKGWSKSELADVTDEAEMLRREKQKRVYEDKQYEAAEKRREAQRAHDKKMAERLEETIERRKEELEEDREFLEATEIEKREAEIKDSETMHEALLLSIVEGEQEQANKAEAPVEANDATPAEPAPEAPAEAESVQEVAE